MLNLSPHSNNCRHQLPVEVIEPSILPHSEKPRLPRHISSWEISRHKAVNRYSSHHAPKKCPLSPNADSTTAINLAVNILRYQLQDHAAQQKHLENLRCNLQHRLEVAQAMNNNQLVTILEEESKQLKTTI